MRAILASAGPYALVSAGALSLDSGVMAALVLAGAHPVLAGCYGYLVGMVAHWALSLRFVFRAQAEAEPARRNAQAAAFFGAGLAGLAITGAILALATALGLGPAPAKALAVMVAFVAVYLARRLVAFPVSAASASP